MTGNAGAAIWACGARADREGYCADLVLFDAEKIIDTATFSDPVRAAKGIEACG
jgi:N-acyl-D-aspartate/D-glutamate deacylase